MDWVLGGAAISFVAGIGFCLKFITAA